jgi:hypothetical protein
MTFAPRTWVVGEVVSAAIMNQEVRDQFNSFFGAWTTYTPTWSSTGTAPALNNGTISGRYMKIGRSVLCFINLTFGSTTTYGSGNYNLSLPVQAASSGIAVVGSAHYLNTARWVGQIVISSAASNCSAFFPAGTADTRTNFMTPSLPETLASGGQLRLAFLYEAVS